MVLAKLQKQGITILHPSKDLGLVALSRQISIGLLLIGW